MRICDVFELLHHRNPARPGTPTKLPDDMGAFARMSPGDRYVRVSPSNISPNRKDRIITLPNKKNVKLKFLGEGHATMAFHGEDGWVYLLTKTEESDPAKQVLTALVTKLGNDDAEYVKHIPWIEEVGLCEEIPGVDVSEYNTWLVHRMPFYDKLTNDYARKQANIAQRIYDKVVQKRSSKAKTVVFMRELDAFADAILLAGQTGKMEASVSEALWVIAKWLNVWVKYHPPEQVVPTEGFALEFQNRNLAQDEHGNLILLDVFFWYINLDGLDAELKKLGGKK